MKTFSNKSSRILHLPLFLAIFLLNILVISSQSYVQKQKISVSDRAAGDNFGWNSAINGNYAIIGASSHDKDASGGNILANAGAAYIFHKDANNRWTKVQKLVPNDRTAGDYFGNAIDIDGNFAVVGSPSDDHDQNGTNTKADAGSVYIYEKNVAGVWNQVQKIVPSDRAASDYFGYSVALSGNYLLVGSRQDDEDTSNLNTLSNAGSAYMFERNGSGIWVRIQKICPDDRRLNVNFGHCVVLEGDQALIGAFQDSTGSAYSFVKQANGRWMQTQKINPPIFVMPMSFGFTIGISGKYSVIGARSDCYDQDGNNFSYVAGAAYFYEKVGSSWQFINKVVASDRTTVDLFGISVDISGSTAVIGSYEEDEDRFGKNKLDNSGSAYIISMINGKWVQTNKICASDRAAKDEFGRSVKIENGTVIAGSYLDDEDSTGNKNLTDAGSVYIFTECTNNTAKTISASACVKYISPSGNQTWDSSGTYTDIIPNSFGCDSVITVNLTITKVNTGITKTGKILTAVATGASYRWLNCSNLSFVAGETQKNFTPSISGDYAVEVTQNGCMDTSVCLNVNLSSILSSVAISNIHIYPNPNNGDFIIDVNNVNKDFTIDVLDLRGVLVYRINSTDLTDMQLHLNLTDGIYFLTVYYEGNKETHQLRIIR